MIGAPISLYASFVIGSLSFKGTKFFDVAQFSRARVMDSLYFRGTHFVKNVFFLGTAVEYERVFEAAVFDSDAAFERAEFGRSARFREREENGYRIPAANFGGVANFKATKIGGQANFIGVTFNCEVRMTATKFDEAYFRQAKFLPVLGPIPIRDVMTSC